jgi:hypothetical protein
MYGNFSGWWIAGLKVTQTDGLLIKNHRAIGNQTYGLWFDIRTTRMVVDNYTAFDNRNAAVFDEISAGPLLVQNSLPARSHRKAVFVINDSRDITLRNVILHSALNADLDIDQRDGVISLISDSGRTPIDGGQSDDPNDLGPLKLEHVVVSSPAEDNNTPLVYSFTGDPAHYRNVLQNRLTMTNVTFFSAAGAQATLVYRRTARFRAKTCQHAASPRATCALPHSLPCSSGA